jgi:hypothetical protein
MKDCITTFCRWIIPLAACITLCSCLTMSTLSAQMTAQNTNCRMQDIKISDEVEDLNGERRWTASCNGRSYYCFDYDDSDSECTEFTDDPSP